jgi:hypothetical protein
LGGNEPPGESGDPVIISRWVNLNKELWGPGNPSMFSPAVSGKEKVDRGDSDLIWTR